MEMAGRDEAAPGLRVDMAGARLAVVKSAQTLVWRLLALLLTVDALTSIVLPLFPGSRSWVTEAVGYTLMAVIATPTLYWLTLKPMAALAEEQARLASEARFQAIANAAHEGILISDEHFQIRYANPAAASAFGYDHGNLRGADVRALLSAEVAASFASRAADFLPTGKGQMIGAARVELSGRKKNGEVIPLELTISTLPDRRERLFFTIVRDITERKMAEEYLRQSEAQFRMLADSVPVTIWLSDTAGKCTYVNKVWTEYTGYAQDSDLGAGWAATIHPEDVERTEEVYMQAVQARAECTIKYRLRENTGGYRWMLDRGKPRFAPDGTYLGHIGVCFDVHERIEAENALQESEAKFRALTESTASAILITDANDRILYANPAVRQSTGYAEDELSGMTWMDLVHPDFRGPMAQNRQARLAGKNAPSRYEIKIQRKDGELAWADLTATIIQYDGAPAILGSAFDITDRKQAEETLWERTQQLNALVESSPLGIVTVDQRGRITLCNPAFEHMFQYSLGELAGANLDDTIAPPYLINEARQITARAGQGERTQLITRRRRRDGALIDVEMFGVPLVVEGETVGAYCLYQDLTARRDLENAIRESEERYRRLFDQANDAIVLIDPDTHFLLDANRKAMETYGLDSFTVRQMRAEQLGEISAHSQEAIQRLEGSAPAVSFEAVYTDRNGRTMFQLVSASVVDYGGRRVLMSIRRDITERKQMEAALRQSEERFRRVADSVPVQLWMTDSRGQPIFGNREEESFTGLSAAELNAGRWLESIHADDRPAVVQDLQQLHKNPAPFVHENRMRHRDGTYHWVLVHGRPRYSDQGAFEGFTGCVLDVSEKKRAEELLMASERKMRVILDALPVAVRILQDDRIVFANPADARIHGYSSPEEEIGNHWMIDIAPGERNRMNEIHNQRLAGKDMPRRLTVRRARLDGSEFHSESTLEPIQYDGRPAFVIAIHDLTEREKLALYEKLLPVCCMCGKIRDDGAGPSGGGQWDRLDRFVARHSDAQISHTFCPACLAEYKQREGLA